MSRRSPTRGEGGAAVVMGSILVVLLTVFAVICAGLVAVVVVQRKAQAAADLAALAGAGALQAGQVPCDAAVRIAAGNGVRDVTCSVAGAVVEVVVRVRLPRIPGAPVVRARARAGPGSPG